MIQKGSEWHKWDFHVHTPYSCLNNGFGNPSKEETWDEYVHELFTKAIKNSISAIGITDYFVIDGYIKLLTDYLQNEEKLKELFAKEIAADNNYLDKIYGILLFPNIEFRSDTAITSTEGKSSKLQFHVLFSNELSPDVIALNFLNVIRLSMIGRDGKKEFPLTDEWITNYGKEILKQNLDKNEKNEKILGYKYASVQIDRVIEVLKESSIFKDKYIIVGVEEDLTDIKFEGQAGEIRREYLAKMNAMFSSNPKSVNWYKSKECKETIEKYLPCIWGSDAHEFGKMFNPDLNRFCWIKADVCFNGFFESLESPDNRVFIGALPDDLNNYMTRKSYTIGTISCHPKASGQWFDFDIPLNPFMVSVIGNKGSGKSALTDIISRVANTSKIKFASFLNNERFCQPTSKFHNDYRASLSFCDEGSIYKTEDLDNSYESSKPELVKYLPQRFIETVCNDLNSGFQEEINDVLFSFITPLDRLGCSSLAELVSKKTSKHKADISELINELDDINQRIVKLEKMMTKVYKDKLSSDLEKQNIRLNNHLSQKPIEVKKPESADNDGFALLANKLDQSILDINKEIEKVTEEYNSVVEKVESLKLIFEKIEHLGADVSSINDEIKNYVESYSLGFASEVGLTSNLGELQAFYKELIEQRKDKYESLTSNDVEHEEIDTIPSFDVIEGEAKKVKSLFDRKALLQFYRNLCTDKTNSAVQAYLKYESDFQRWEKIRKMILGDVPDETGEGNIKSLKDELSYIENDLSKDYAGLLSQRIELSECVFDSLELIKHDYEEIYAPIQAKLDEIIKNNDEKIRFDVRIDIASNFADEFCGMLNQAVLSKYRGIVEGKSFVKKSTAEFDFSKKDEVVQFLKLHQESLTENIDRLESLTKGHTVELYNYLYSLKYLKANYSLVMGEKTIKELSPGERGILLLIFYLSLDTNSCPLIIDQPEDNLDNQSIYSKLVPCIIEAKKHRQIIVVTHNPNIAVACDSEQVIYCSKDKNENRITYDAGSIENPFIKGKIIDILEGTEPAFNYRKVRYQIK